MKKQRLDNVAFELTHKQDEFGLMQPITDLFSVVVDEKAEIESISK